MLNTIESDSSGIIVNAFGLQHLSAQTPSTSLKVGEATAGWCESSKPETGRKAVQLVCFATMRIMHGVQ